MVVSYTQSINQTVSGVFEKGKRNSFVTRR
jgi:hypothetical protein